MSPARSAECRRPIAFMSSNRDEYRALGDPETLARIVAVEERLSELTRYYMPEE